MTGRMPISAERAGHNIGEGVPLFVVTLPDGSTRVYPAERWQLRQTGTPGSL
ncbi:hypothetical protein BJY16_006157 [Actinoplanes octamycinicus]|uniref:Uncharacterized protein n=1 Tax=Actinoplanes octamycinicus TaxID=135948 RepID=A0A7W7MA45_9ACTN|nr:hypothetical protein [Actinoplanes octamycinicus]